MPKPPSKPKKPKDPARPTRAKAAAEHMKPLAPALEQLLNPGIAKGTAGVGAQTGLQPPADNSFDRRADFSKAHTARKSTKDKGFGEAPQAGYVGKGEVEINKGMAEALGYKEDDLSGLRSSGITATVQALENLLREGR
jgi:excinuclease ABC subunit B